MGGLGNGTDGEERREGSDFWRVFEALEIYPQGGSIGTVGDVSHPCREHGAQERMSQRCCQGLYIRSCYLINSAGNPRSL